MSLLRRLKRSQRGAALTEFAFSSLLMILVLMTTIEFGIEMFMRQQAERAAGTAAVVFGETRSPQKAQDAAQGIMLRGFSDCIEPLEITLHNGINSLKNGSGREARGNPSDDGSQFAKVVLTCNWDRLTPGSRLMLGPRITHRSSTYVRIR